MMMFRNNNPQQEDALFLMDSCIYFLYNEACPVYIFFLFIYYFFYVLYLSGCEQDDGWSISLCILFLRIITTCPVCVCMCESVSVYVYNCNASQFLDPNHLGVHSVPVSRWLYQGQQPIPDPHLSHLTTNTSALPVAPPPVSAPPPVTAWLYKNSTHTLGLTATRLYFQLVWSYVDF